MCLPSIESLRKRSETTIRVDWSDVKVIKIVYRDVVVLFYVLRKKALRFRFDLEHDNDRPEVIFFLSK